MDRADFDAAAGRTVFQNVLLADPQAFSSRPRLRRGVPAVVTAPATTGMRLQTDTNSTPLLAARSTAPSRDHPRRSASKLPDPSRSAPCELFCPRRMGDKAHVRSGSGARGAGRFTISF